LIASRSLVLFYDSRTQSPNDLNVLRSMLHNGGRTESNTNESYSASADGSVWDLPAGPIRLAVGGEYRIERARTTQAVPDDPRFNLSLVGNFRRAVESAFAETRVPIVSEKQRLPLLHSLELSAAARYDTYSDIGGHISPGYGLIWRPVKWALVRASRNYAFRAPGLQALYRPVTNGGLTIFGFSIPTRDPQRGGTPLPLGSYTSLIGGNLDLKPEKSISDNVGIVIESPFELLKGLSFSVDYQVLDYTDRLQNPLFNIQQIFDFFPDRITRGANLPGDLPGWAGVPTLIDVRTVNIAKLEIQAVDYQVGYHRVTPWGTLDARVALTDYLKYLATSVPGTAPVSTLYQFPTRLSWQAYLTKGPYGFGVSGFYQEKQYLDLTYTTPRFRSAVEWNAQLAYDFDRRTDAAGRNDTRLKRWLFAGTKLSLTVNNVFDREPPHIEGNAGFAVTDPRMARYVLTLRKAF
ncbi:MAG: TonB-dependent receptor, partial [Opitutae bacterium]|nr:TonB-dependent receptor [Opitutae bacterium]